MPRRMLPGDWKAEHVQRLWEFFAVSPHAPMTYFSSLAGDGVVRFLEFSGRLRGRVLDFGCGPGFLLEKLLARNVECWGCDSSKTAVDDVNHRFSRRPNWRGALLSERFPIDIAGGLFDLVVCVELLEHLTDEWMHPLLEELRRIVSPQGSLFFSTPACEELDVRMVYCPFCDTVFHPVQHVRSFSPESLAALLKGAGFGVVFCNTIDFRAFMDAPQLNGAVAGLWNRAQLWKARFLDRMLPQAFPAGREFRLRYRYGDRLCVLVAPLPELGAERCLRSDGGWSA